jgi:micrococcal nuclease
MSATPSLPKSFTIPFTIIVVLAGLYNFQSQGVLPFKLPTTLDATTTPAQTFYKVTKVTDGDTIHVSIDGKDEKVRFIGINTPETVDPRTPVQCFGKEASDRMKSLAEGNLVRLEYDDSQSVRDTYGRLLAYVYLQDGEMLNRKMIAEGYAYEYTYLTPYKYQKEFRDLQTLARTQARGLWGPNTCNGKK